MNLSSYVWSGLIVLVLSWAMNGCRFGNRIERAEDPDKISGYYETQPIQAIYCVSGNTEKCVTTASNRMPAEVAAVMSDPIWVFSEDPQTGRPSIRNAYQTQNRLSVWIDPTLDADKKEIPGQYTLSYAGEGAPEVLWLDESCTSKIALAWNGSLDQSKARVSGTVTYRGRAALRFQVTTAFQDTCGPSLNDMYACYMNADDCGGGSASNNAYFQKVVQSIFAEHIEAGAMVAEDIPFVRGIGYEALYE